MAKKKKLKKIKPKKTGLAQEHQKKQVEDNESNRIGRIGHHLISIQLELHEMIPSDLSVDKGEDVSVQVFNDGSFTGASFYGQYKSKSDLPIRDGIISCSVKSNRLDRWNASGIPVFLFVTNINTRIVYWIEINDELVRGLDQRDASWREQENITVYLPENNKVDGTGAKRIREIVMRRFAPMLLANKTLELQLKTTYPDTDEGREAQRQMQRWHDAGDPVVIPAQFIKELKVSEWFTRWHGGPIVIPPQSAIRLAPVPSTEDRTFQVKLLDVFGKVTAIRNVVMRAIKGGKTETTYTNDHNPTPLHCQLVMRSENGGTQYYFSISTHGSRTTIQDAKGSLPFYKALALGGTIQIRLKDSKSIVKSPLCSGLASPGEFPEIDEDFQGLLDRCSSIQDRTGSQLILTDLRFTEQDIQDIDVLTTILDAGHVTRELERLPFTLTPVPSDTGESVRVLAEGLLKADDNGGPFPISADVGEVEVEVMGARISLGVAKYHILGTLAPESKTQLQSYLRNPQCVGEMEACLINAQMTEEYSEWAPEPFGIKSGSKSIR